MDTIFALASAQGRAGVAVIRLSGPQAFEIAERMCGALPKPRVAGLRTVRSRTGEILDEALVLKFEAPNSFTGEDSIEFHLHGSVAVVKAVLTDLGSCGRARLADPGEFTRRALENDKLDLTKVEGLADLIEAETEAQRKQALRALSGALGKQVEKWRRDLIRAASLLEATIDFADEEVPLDVTPEVQMLLGGVIEDLEAEVSGSFAAECIRSGFEVAIVGPPNAGKSTLLNRLAGREAAITSDVAGTTRDVIEVRMDLGGLPVTVLDTAGLRKSEDQVESIGVSRALERACQADLRIFLANKEEKLMLEPLVDDIVLVPKIDLNASQAPGISGKTGEGVEELVKRIHSVLSQRAQLAGLATHERHRVCISNALCSLQDAQTSLKLGPDRYDIVAEDLRSGIRFLEVLMGRIDVENLLDEIFSSFCLGK